MVEDEAATPRVGVVVTLMVTVLMDPVQEPLAPVMLYIVVAAGLNTLDVPEPDGSQV